jgi:hypothetical protein
MGMPRCLRERRDLVRNHPIGIGADHRAVDCRIDRLIVLIEHIGPVMTARPVQSSAQMPMNPVSVARLGHSLERFVPSRINRKVRFHTFCFFVQLTLSQSKFADCDVFIDPVRYENGKAQQCGDGNRHQHADHNDHSIAQFIAPHDALHGLRPFQEKP